MADTLRACLAGGTVPTVLRACAIVSRGRQRGLKSVTLPSGRIVSPSEDLLFALAEERLEPNSWPGAKASANSCTSGIFAQMNDAERRARVLQHIWRADGRTHTEYGVDVEEPARWYFPPFAATVMGGSRLLLYLACTLIEAAGGTIAYRDTDAPAVVATLDGGLVPCEGGTEIDGHGRACVRALSFAEVEAALAPLEALNPYRRRYGDAAPPLLKIEDDNLHQDGLVEAFLHARSVKNYDRYRLVRSNGKIDVAITKASEHGLGHLHPHWLDLTRRPEVDWVVEGRRYELQRDLGLDVTEPAWFGDVALSVKRLTSWKDLKPFLPSGSPRRRGNGPRPFSRVAVAHPDPLHAYDDEGRRVTRVALWSDGASVGTVRWRDLETTRPLRLRAPRDELREADISAGGPVPVKTMRDVFTRLAHRHDYGLDHAGQPTSRATSGLVKPSPTNALLVIAIGREATNLDRVGVTADPAYRVYVDHDRNPWTLARDTLRLLAHGMLGPGRPREDDKVSLIQRAGELARAELAKSTGDAGLPVDPVVACFLYLVSVGKLRVVCDGCGRRLGRRERRWCQVCRKDRRGLARSA